MTGYGYRDSDGTKAGPGIPRPDELYPGSEDSEMHYG
jgi:hypothetical protein